LRDQATASQDPPISKYEERFIELDREAIEGAYREHIQKLYSVWMQNYTPDQPSRAVTGAQNAREAFINSMDAIERRKQVLDQQTPVPLPRERPAEAPQ
jgi:hypothetical protein